MEVFGWFSSRDFVQEEVAVEGLVENEVLEKVRRLGVYGREDDMVEGVEGFEDELGWESASLSVRLV